MLSWLKTIKQIQINRKALSLIIIPGRVSFSLPFFLKAGIALEGCLVMPLFLFFMATLLYSLEMVRFQSDVYEAMHQVGSKVCFGAYEQAYGQGTAKFTDEEAAGEVKQYLQEQILPFLCVEGESEGVAVSVMQDSHGKGNVEIRTSYVMKPFIRWLPIGNIRIQDVFFGHGFVGYMKDCGLNGEGETEIYVYITPSGSKYHFSENCTYLKIVIRAVPIEESRSLRNGSGEKYYPCEYCGPGGGLVYLTEWGNRYHGKADCSALKRTVYVVPLSEAGGRTACSKCG